MERVRRAIIALKCETDFVAKNEDFVALTQAILDAAPWLTNARTLDEVKALPMGKGYYPRSLLRIVVVSLARKWSWMATA